MAIYILAPGTFKHWHSQLISQHNSQSLIWFARLWLQQCYVLVFLRLVWAHFENLIDTWQSLCRREFVTAVKVWETPPGGPVLCEGQSVRASTIGLDSIFATHIQAQAQYTLIACIFRPLASTSYIWRYSFVVPHNLILFKCQHYMFCSVLFLTPLLSVSQTLSNLCADGFFALWSETLHPVPFMSRILLSASMAVTVRPHPLAASSCCCRRARKAGRQLVLVNRKNL